MILDLIAVVLGVIILCRINTMSKELARLQSEVAEETEVVASVLALIDGLSTQIRDHAEDPAALNALADTLDDNSNKLAAAVASNTPAVGEGAPEELPAEDLEPIEPTPADDTTGGAAGGGEPAA